MCNYKKINLDIKKPAGILITLMLSVGVFSVQADLPSEGPRLGSRILQGDLVNMSIDDIRLEGQRIFSTPFNFKDGLGDGPFDLDEDPTVPGGRPSLQGGGFILRFNGNDSQTCLECHSVLSNATIPASFAVGGFGNISDSAFPGIINPDIDDDGDDGSVADDGNANMIGRMINAPFNFGAGGVEALAKEMTRDLQAMKGQAEENPGQVVNLITKGVSFGSIIFDGDDLDTSNVEGINADLVVRPFGRKGCCFSIRDFDRGAMQFHHGMQPEEVVGSGIDADGDGVVDELTIGEMSALHVFQAALEPPSGKKDLTQQEGAGKTLFTGIGCAGCHIPELTTNSNLLPVAFPEDPTDPSANVFLHVDLEESDYEERNDQDEGVIVPLFADLKRHHMGAGLVELTGAHNAGLFTTARLWGVADSAPYMHDGSVMTLSQAILSHGGEAEGARDGFANLAVADQEAVVAYLRTLKTPKNPNKDLRLR